MKDYNKAKANKTLFLNTLTFAVCFFVWMIFSVLITFLNGKFEWSQWSDVEVAWLIALPVLTGSVFRLPIGVLTDKYGGKPVMIALLLFTAIPTYLLSFANGFWSFALCGVGFGLAGTSFAVGIAYTSIWFPKRKQGFALGIFGMGNVGAAITAMFAPKLLTYLTDDRTNLEGWVNLPRIYAIVLVAVSFIFYILTDNKKVEQSSKSIMGLMKPLKDTRVWRFGLYYFLVFGGFVALIGWLQRIYKNVYTADLIKTDGNYDLEKAGMYVAIFVIASSVIRAFGGYLSDKFGARSVMRTVLILSLLISSMLIIWTPAHVHVFLAISLMFGGVWGVGMAAVYKYIPDYYPQEVGVVGGMVGVLGGLGGFVCPIVFGYLKDGTGMWSSSWMFMAFLSVICLVWMYKTILEMNNQKTTLIEQIETSWQN